MSGRRVEGDLRHTGRGQRGQTALLVVGLALVAAALVGVVVDASAAYLQRQGLASLADGAALAAADGVRGESVYTGGLGDGRVEVDPDAAAAHVAAYLAAVDGSARYPGLRFRVWSSGDRVVVRVNAPLHLPLPPPEGLVRTPVVAATAAAVVRLAS